MDYDKHQLHFFLSKAFKSEEITHLYKYRADNEATLKIFKNNSLWFAQPTSFNDPFDCSLSIKKGTKRHEIERYYRKTKILSKGDLKKVLNFTMPSDAEEKFELVYRNLISEVGVLCLTRSFDNTLMWSHYANGHKGCVIELNVAEDYLFMAVPMSVEYVESYEPLDFFKDPKEATRKMISYKSHAWSYEKEIRIHKDKFGEYKFNKKLISRIIFGCYSSKIFIKEVMQACEEG